MRQQAERFGAEYKMEMAHQADLSCRPFTVVTDKQTYRTETLIVASGASAQLLGLESERKLIGKGVSTCATCDGYFFRGQRIIVVGGGDSAMEEAIFLTRFAQQVTVVHRRDQLRASKIMAERTMNNPKIDFLWDTVVVDISDPESGKVESVRLRNVQTNEEFDKEIAGVFVAIGHQPNTNIFQGQIEMENGYIAVRNGSRSSVEGVFIAGDVHDQVYRQAVTAAGAGCKAAMDAEKFLEEGGPSGSFRRLGTRLTLGSTAPRKLRSRSVVMPIGWGGSQHQPRRIEGFQPGAVSRRDRPIAPLGSLGKPRDSSKPGPLEPDFRPGPLG